MSQPIRILHFADTHIGMENYGKTDPATGVSSRVSDFLQRIDEMIDFAFEHDVDLVVFAGDAFRSRSPNPTYQREFAARIRRLSQLAPTLLLLGNHDLPANIAKASTLDIFATLDVPGVIVAGDYAVQRIATKRGDLIIGTAPWPIRARLLDNAEARKATMREQDALLREALHQKLEDLARAAASNAGESLPRLLVGHFGVSGAKGGSESALVLGRDPAVDLEKLADPRWDYVALGHIHRHQNLTRSGGAGPPVVYCGSPERIDFSEEHEAKGFCWVELERGRASWRFVPTAARKLLTLRVDCRGAASPTRRVLEALAAHQLRDVALRLVIQLTPEGESQLKDGAITDALRQAGVFHIAGLRKEVEREHRARLDASPEGLTPLQLLDRYFQARDVDEARRQQLLGLTRKLMDDEFA